LDCDETAARKQQSYLGGDDEEENGIDPHLKITPFSPNSMITLSYGNEAGLFHYAFFFPELDGARMIGCHNTVGSGLNAHVFKGFLLGFHMSQTFIYIDQ
jgi:hypothetical protein